jgi:hypothetical protein
LVLFSPYLPKDWSDGIPVSDSLPPEFDCQWGGDNGTDFAPRRNECFGVVVQLYNRHTQWLRARFTGTITKKSKSWFGSSSTQHLHDTAVQFPPNTTVTAKLMASAPYRF